MKEKTNIKIYNNIRIKIHNKNMLYLFDRGLTCPRSRSIVIGRWCYGSRNLSHVSTARYSILHLCGFSTSKTASKIGQNIVNELAKNNKKYCEQEPIPNFQG